MLRLFVSSVITLIVLASPVLADTFGDHWYDGKGELDGYALRINRYGETRDGTAVMIFVTEPFRESTRVKADDPSRNAGDVFSALKLNLVRDFQTGIYDYNTMVSVFSRDDDFTVSKVSFSSAEWCGHVYQEMNFHDRTVEGVYHSYFEGESGPVSLERPEDGVSEDNLFILLRDLRGTFLNPGEKRTVPFLPSPFYTRISHTDMAWTKAVIERSKDTQNVTVPAGPYEARVYTVRVDGGRTGTFHIEDAYPHRIVKWSLDPDVSGELTGSLRVPYWRLHDNRHQGYLEQLGLSGPAQ
jgi:hypothetical protein